MKKVKQIVGTKLYRGHQIEEMAERAYTQLRALASELKQPELKTLAEKDSEAYDARILAEINRIWLTNIPLQPEGKVLTCKLLKKRKGCVESLRYIEAQSGYKVLELIDNTIKNGA